MVKNIVGYKDYVEQDRLDPSTQMRLASSYGSALAKR